jgi:hypothetical protein
MPVEILDEVLCVNSRRADSNWIHIFFEVFVADPLPININIRVCYNKLQI